MSKKSFSRERREALSGDPLSIGVQKTKQQGDPSGRKPEKPAKRHPFLNSRKGGMHFTLFKGRTNIAGLRFLGNEIVGKKNVKTTKTTVINNIVFPTAGGSSYLEVIGALQNNSITTSKFSPEHQIIHQFSQDIQQNKLDVRSLRKYIEEQQANDYPELQLNYSNGLLDLSHLCYLNGHFFGKGDKIDQGDKILDELVSAFPHGLPETDARILDLSDADLTRIELPKYLWGVNFEKTIMPSLDQKDLTGAFGLSGESFESSENFKAQISLHPAYYKTGRDCILGYQKIVQLNRELEIREEGARKLDNEIQGAENVKKVEQLCL